MKETGCAIIKCVCVHVCVTASPDVIKPLPDYIKVYVVDTSMVLVTGMVCNVCIIIEHSA